MKKKFRESCKMYCVGNDVSYDFDGQEKNYIVFYVI